jgi:hypothetical protein
MFARVKKSGDYQYVQVVHNERIGGRVRQRVIATLGRLDVLNETRRRQGLLESLGRFSDHAAVLNALKANQITPTRTIHVGPVLVFQKLWEQLGLPGILQRLLAGRTFEFPLERVVFIAVLHRLFAPGSGRALVSPVHLGPARRSGTAALLSHDGLVRRTVAAGPTTAHAIADAQAAQRLDRRGLVRAAA